MGCQRLRRWGSALRIRIKQNPWSESFGYTNERTENMNINWSTKEEYLQFVGDWKTAYKELSAAIRSRRLSGRALMSLSHNGTKYPGVTAEIALKRQQESAATVLRIKKSIVPALRDTEMYMRDSSFATWLLRIRAESKDRAGVARAEALVRTFAS